MKNITIKEFFKQFPDDETCLKHIFETRFGQGYECPKCKKAAKWYRIQAERAYSCQWCGNHLHPTAGTIFEDSRTSLQMWFYAIYLFTTTRNGVSAKELQRQLGVTYKCAWRMGHQIRKHMAEVDGEDSLSGTIEIDETLIGGKRKGKRGRGAIGKTVLFGMMEKDGDIITHPVPDVKRRTLYPVIEQHIAKGSTIHSDELRSYQTLNTQGYEHQTVNHGAKEYVRSDVHVNSLEGFWSLLKRAIKSTHIHVSAKHLDKYAKEFEFRFNVRHAPALMFSKLLDSF